MILLSMPATNFAATIEVTALPNSPGCDLVEAINSANSNSSIGGCTSGSDGLDTIIFSTSLSSYSLDSIASSNPITGSSATPEITSEISIIGPGTDLFLLEGPRDDGLATRAFTIVGNGDLSLENLLLTKWSQSQGFDGGALRVNGKLTLNNVDIVDNSATFGGAIWVQTGELIIRNSLIRENSAGERGGGIGVSAYSKLTIYDSTISNNHADYGGGIALAAAPSTQLSLFNTTITENSADIRGGGLSIYFASIPEAEGNSVIIRNSILSGNLASNYDEIEFINPSEAESLELQNNTLGSSASTYSEATNYIGFLTNNNVILAADAENIPIRSILGPLSDNGGKTMTHALVDNSPAIDAAIRSPAILLGTLPFQFLAYLPGCAGELVEFSLPSYRTDQRGFTRPIGNECDIGAYEYEPVDDCFVIMARNNNVISFCI